MARPTERYQVGIFLMTEVDITPMVKPTAPKVPRCTTDHAARFRSVLRFPAFDSVLSQFEPFGTLHVLAIRCTNSQAPE